METMNELQCTWELLEISGLTKTHNTTSTRMETKYFAIETYQGEL
jgi:hypothetical protein